MGCGAHGQARRDLYAVGGDGGAHAVQSGGGRHGKGTSGSRDRRARRLDGRWPSTRLASSSSCSIAAAGRRCGHRARRRTSDATASGCIARYERSRISNGSSAAPAGSKSIARASRVSRSRAVNSIGAARSSSRPARSSMVSCTSGREQRPSGRAGEPPSRDLAESIKSIGFTWGRLKTGTPPRLDRRSIDFSAFAVERGDEPPVPFSFTTERIERDQIDCYLLHTNDRVHELVRDHIGESPLFNGQISGIGPRYCPSLEDKVMRFAHRDRHQLFLEPEGLDVDEIYINGFSMSLPAELQEQLVHALPGLEAAVVMRPGYAVEYRFRATDRIEADAGNQATAWAVSRRSDQRDVRLRRGRGAGSRGRDQCGVGRRRLRSIRPVENDELHRHDDRRPDHQGMPRALSHVHVARRASAASEDR